MRAVAPYREGSEYCTMIARACKKLLGKKRARTRIFLAHSLKKTGTVSQHTPVKMANGDRRRKRGVVNQEREYAFKDYCK
jgi:hypothetical protein